MISELLMPVSIMRVPNVVRAIRNKMTLVALASLAGRNIVVDLWIRLKICGALTKSPKKIE